MRAYASPQHCYTGTYFNCPVKSTQDVTVTKHDTGSYNRVEGTDIVNLPHILNFATVCDGSGMNHTVLIVQCKNQSGERHGES